MLTIRLCSVIASLDVWAKETSASFTEALKEMADFLESAEHDEWVRVFGGRSTLMLYKMNVRDPDFGRKIIFTGPQELIHLLTMITDKAVGFLQKLRNFQKAQRESPN